MNAFKHVIFLLTGIAVVLVFHSGVQSGIRQKLSFMRKCIWKIGDSR